MHSLHPLTGNMRALIISITTLLVWFNSWGQREGHERINVRAVERAIYRLNFDEEPIGAVPLGWRTWGGEWRVDLANENQLLRQAAMMPQGSCYAVVICADYLVAVRARCIRGSIRWGMGVVAYWNDAQNHYRLMSYGDQVHLVKVANGRVTTLGYIPFVFEQERWYWFKLWVANAGERVLLWGKVWDAEQREPQEWLVMAEDLSPVVYQGWAGVWCAKSICEFDDFQVAWGVRGKAPLVCLREDFESYPAGRAPPTWTLLGGQWKIQTSGSKVLRQQKLLNKYQFEHNCYAIVEGWRAYTITARMRCKEGAEVWGMGLVANWRGTRWHYSLLNIGTSKLVLWSITPSDEKPNTLAESNWTIERGKWYWFKMQVNSDLECTKLKAKVWSEGEPEPTEWMMQAVDTTPARSLSGTFGFVSLAASCDFDDLEIAFPQTTTAKE